MRLIIEIEGTTESSTKLCSKVKERVAGLFNNRTTVKVTDPSIYVPEDHPKPGKVHREVMEDIVTAINHKALAAATCYDKLTGTYVVCLGAGVPNEKDNSMDFLPMALIDWNGGGNALLERLVPPQGMIETDLSHSPAIKH